MAVSPKACRYKYAQVELKGICLKEGKAGGPVMQGLEITHCFGEKAFLSVAILAAASIRTL
jgi:hypothetical protein